MINYPNGKAYVPSNKTSRNDKKKMNPLDGFAKRGMGLEEDLNLSNAYYNLNHLCLIFKRPTPIKVVKMKQGKITEAYFAEKSTTDYNGVYKGRYMDFEAKETISRTSFALANIRPQQITHLQEVISQGGIAFFIIRMKAYNETYLLDCRDFLPLLKTIGRKSFPYDLLKKKGHIIKDGFNPRLSYLDTVDEVYFNDKG